MASRGLVARGAIAAMAILLAGAAERPSVVALPLEMSGPSTAARTAAERAVADAVAARRVFDLVATRVASPGATPTASCAAEACAAEIGRALGVDLVVTGSVIDVGAHWFVALRLIDVERRVLLARSSALVEETVPGLVAALDQGVGALVAGWQRDRDTGGAAALPAPDEPRPAASLPAPDEPRPAASLPAPDEPRPAASLPAPLAPPPVSTARSVPRPRTDATTLATTATTRPTWPWITGAGAVVSAGAAVTAGVLALNARSRARDINQSSAQHDYRELMTAQSDFEHWRTLTTLAAALAVCLGVTTGVGLLTETRSLAVAPLVAPGLAGVVVGGRLGDAPGGTP